VTTTILAGPDASDRPISPGGDVPKSGRVARTGSPRRALTQLATAEATGVLHVGGEPGGSVHLNGGLVTHAESPSAPGIGALLTTSGRLTGDTWRSALTAAGPDGRVGHWLVAQGHLTRGELELCALAAVYDAAYFALSAPTAALRFEEETAPWNGAEVAVDAGALLRETTRRRRLLDEIHPGSDVDGVAVAPAPRAPVPRVALTALQWEILAHADGTRTPTDLARVLGRAGFAVLQEVRRLAASGLLATASPVAVGAPGSVGAAAVAGRAAAAAGKTSGATGTAGASGAAGTGGKAEAAGRAAVPDAAGAAGAAAASANGANGGGSAKGGKQAPPIRAAAPTETPSGKGGAKRGSAKTAAPARDTLPALPHRDPGARLPPLGDPPPDGPEPADEALLKRIRSALKALR
jgi:hypothetical protein